LTAAEAMLEQQVNGKPWPSVERWLLNLDGQRQAMQRQVQSQMGHHPSLEDSLWRLDFQPLANGDGYILKLWAIWSGPAASQGGYYLEKSCLLMPVNRSAPIQGEDAPPGYTTTQWASLTCDLETPRQAGHPRATERRG
jgi:hypothetical protein